MSRISDTDLRNHMTNTYNFDEKDFVFDEKQVKNSMSKELKDNYNKGVLFSKDDLEGDMLDDVTKVINSMTKGAGMSKNISEEYVKKIIDEAVQIGHTRNSTGMLNYKELIDNIGDVFERYDTASDKDKGNITHDDSISKTQGAGFSVVSKGAPHTPFTFTLAEKGTPEYQKAFDHLDTYKNAPKNNKISREAMLRYINQFYIHGVTFVDDWGSGSRDYRPVILQHAKDLCPKGEYITPDDFDSIMAEIKKHSYPG